MGSSASTPATADSVVDEWERHEEAMEEMCEISVREQRRMIGGYVNRGVDSPYILVSFSIF
jgi:hypothetical protein